MLVIPAIDLIQGECVRLYQGDYSQKTLYENNPVVQAAKFETAGFFARFVERTLNNPRALYATDRPH